jgi:hypothetical protein
MLGICRSVVARSFKTGSSASIGVRRTAGRLSIASTRPNAATSFITSAGTPIILPTAQKIFFARRNNSPPVGVSLTSGASHGTGERAPLCAR